MVDNKIIERLMHLNISEYEAKAYYALLIKNPLTPYELAKKASISTAKIYEIINKLDEKKMILELIDEGKKKYIPADPDKIIENIRVKTNNSLDILQDQLKNLNTDNKISYILNIADYDFLIEKAKEIIKNTKDTILMSTWKEELKLLADDIKKTVNKKIKTSIIHFGEPEIKIGQIFTHPIANTIYTEKKGRCLVLISDSKEVLMATVYQNGKVEGAYSNNSGFVMIAEDYVKHDIYIMKIVERFDGELIKKFGNNYKKLRDIFTNEEEI